MAQIVKLRRSAVAGKKPTNAQLQLGELSVNTTDGKIYFAKSGSLGETIEEIVSTNTVNTGSISLSGSLNLVGPQNITGSLTITNNLILSGSIVDASGSLGQTNYFLTSDGTNVYWALNESGGGANSYFKKISFLSPSNTWSFNHKLGEKYPIINVYNEDGEQLLPSSITAIDEDNATITFSSEQTGYVVATIGGLFNTFNVTSPSSGWTIDHNFGEHTPFVQVYDENDQVVLPSKIHSLTNGTNTLNITFNGVNVTGKVSVAGSGKSYKKVVDTPTATWTVNHNLGELYPIVQVYNLDDVVIPFGITSIDENTLEVSFNSTKTGVVHVTVGGANLIPTIDNSMDGYVLTTDGNSSYWKGGILSGSAGISQLGFATTGSNTFYGTQTFNGSIVPADSSYNLGSLNNPWGDIYVSSGSIYIGETAKMGSVSQVVSGSVTLIDLGVYNGANFDYIVKNGLNMRGGNIAAVWNGTQSSHNEINTTDLGNTSPVDFSTTNDGKLNVSVSSGTWTIEIIYRALG